MNFENLHCKYIVVNYFSMRQLIQRFQQLQHIHQLSLVGAMVAVALHLLAWLIVSNLDFNVQSKAIESKPLPVILPAPMTIPTPQSSTETVLPVKQTATSDATDPENVKVQNASKPITKPAIEKALSLPPHRAVSLKISSKAQPLKKPDGPLQASTKTAVPPPPATTQHTEIITFTAPFEISGATAPEQTTNVSKAGQASPPRVVAGWQQRQILYAIAARNKAARKRPVEVPEVAPVSNISPSK